MMIQRIWIWIWIDQCHQLKSFNEQLSNYFSLIVMLIRLKFIIIIIYYIVIKKRDGVQHANALF